MELFSLYVCGEVGRGEKYNFELAFNGRPLLEELHERVIEVFSIANVHAGAHLPFVLSHLMMLDPTKRQWETLANVAMLGEQCQLYAKSYSAGDTPTLPVPSPVLPPHAVPSEMTEIFIDSEPSVQTPQLPVSNHHGASPSSSQFHVASRLFALLDQTNSGSFSLAALRYAMLLHHMDVSQRSVGDTFSWGLHHQVTSEDFRRFVAAHERTAVQLLQCMEHSAAQLQTVFPKAQQMMDMPQSEFPRAQPARPEEFSPVHRPLGLSPVARAPTDLSILSSGASEPRRAVPEPRSRATPHPLRPPVSTPYKSMGADMALAQREEALLHELEMVRRERALLNDLQKHEDELRNAKR